jgi:hypothetical protein
MPLTTKKIHLRADQIKSLAEGRGACFATDMIMVGGKKVGYMYREEPDNDIDSGWRFLTGSESQEYMDDAHNHGIYDVNTIANYDPEIIPFLDAPAGSVFTRDASSRRFVAVEEKSIEEYLEQVVSEAETGNTDCCILLEAKKDSGQWVQLTWDSINAAYPFVEEPLMKLKELKIGLFPGLELSSWEQKKYATFEHPAQPLGQLARFVEEYLTRVLGVGVQRKDLRVEQQQL